MRDNYRYGRRPRPLATRTGPIGFFGRGRLASLAVMLAVLTMAYLASNRPVIDQRGAAFSAAGRAAPTRSANTTSAATPTNLIELVDPASRPRTAQRHGGLLLDGRAELVTRVGRRLADAARTSAETQRNTFQVGVLADESQRRVYAFPDGWILVTAGLIQVAAAENEVAALLAESMEAIARSNNSIDTTQPQGTISASWMSQAGYDSSGIASFRARLASMNSREPR